MSQRFFCEAPIRDDEAVLDGQEAHHLLHVMRARAGDEVVLFDGSGVEFAATIEKTGRHEVALRIDERRAVDRELGFPLELAVALPRGERQEWLVQKIVELGATRLIPWQTERSVALPNAKSLARLQRTVIEACKQCGRNRLMTIDEPVEFQAALRSLSTNSAPTCWLAHPGSESQSLPAALDAWRSLDQSPLRLGVGPEGGFSDAEAAAAREFGWQPVSLGPSILRTETAAIALATIAGIARR